MNAVLYILIGIFGSASYIAGGWQIAQGKYRPSVFSRVVWLLLAVNSFAGVILSGSSKSSQLLAAIFLLGNALICLLSLWKGTREVGRLEWICFGLLLVSGSLWLLIDAPLVNLSIGLLAHLIGAVPTYKRVWVDASSESSIFWSLFFIASVFSVLVSHAEPIQSILFPVYFVLFDGSMTILSMRQPRNKK